jgi:acetyl-CoA synthetase
MDNDGNEILETNAEGKLCIKFPWPSMARTIYGNHERFKDTYYSPFPGLYFTGDGAKRDNKGNYRITGRVDDVVIVSGHNLGTAEIENIIDEHEAVTEAAVVGYPHDIKGNSIYAFVTINDSSQTTDTKALEQDIKQLVSNTLGPISKPEIIQFCTGLPKTRSGKIMRRILRKVASNELDAFGDISTLLNPECVQEIVDNRKN